MPISRLGLKAKTDQIMRDILNDAVGWEIKLFIYEKDITNPLKPTSIKKSYPLTALISKNEDAYKRADITNNIEFKVCKIFVSDLEALNDDGAKIPTPPNSLKKSNVTIVIDNGNEFQIKNESFEGFNRRMIVLEIEREV